MKYLITTWFGTFLCDEQGIKQKILFPNKEKEILKRLQQIQDHKILAEEKKLVKKTTVTVQEKRLQTLGIWDPVDPFFTTIHINPETYGFSLQTLHAVSQTLASTNLEKQLEAEDLQIIQMVNALDDLIHISNLLTERVERWCLIPTPKEKSEPFENLVLTVREEMKRLDNQISRDMHGIAPNTTQLIGPLIGARLIALSGGLQHLAMLPASTIQILGAEKALFRFKKEGGKPPKHGIIYQHPLLNRAPRDQRGKIARFFAAKIAIAAKADFFTKRDIASDLSKQLEQKIMQLREK